MMQIRHVCIVVTASIFILMGCTSAQPSASDFVRRESYAVAQTEPTSLQKVMAPQVRAHKGQSGFKLIARGRDALLMRIAMIQAAERSLDLQYYIVQNDDSGKLLLQAIMQAADRGVRVRILVDDITLKKSDPTWALLDAYPNIELRIFNPIFTQGDLWKRIGSFLTDIEHYTKRMHNKVFIADNQLAMIGGRNLGDAYFDNSPDANFRDIDILAAGPITNDISHSFDRYWNGKEAYPITDVVSAKKGGPSVSELREALKKHWQEAMDNGVLKNTPRLVPQLRNKDISLLWSKAELAADSPAKIEQPAEFASSKPVSQIEAMSALARKEFIMVSPYFVPGEDGVEWIEAMEKRGVQVRILTNSLASTDVVSVHSGYRHYRKTILASGAELYEMEPLPGKFPPPGRFAKSSRASLHTKVYVIDRTDVIIGTMNLDPRSAQLNTEIALIVHSVPLAEQVGEIFDHAVSPDSSYRLTLDEKGSLVWNWVENGQEFHSGNEPKAGFWRNFRASLYSILPLENEL